MLLHDLDITIDVIEVEDNQCALECSQCTFPCKPDATLDTSGERCEMCKPHLCIESGGLEAQVMAGLFEAGIPAIVATTASHVSLEEIIGIVIDKLTCTPTGLYIEGTAEASFGLQYGSTTDVEKDFGFEHTLSGTVRYEAEFDPRLNQISFYYDVVESQELDADFLP